MMRHGVSNVCVNQIPNVQILCEAEILFSSRQKLKGRKLESVRPNRAHLPPMTPEFGTQTAVIFVHYWKINSILKQVFITF